MDWHHHGGEVDMEFWPVEHPMEPPDEDRPVKCPMPDSSVLDVRINASSSIYFSGELETVLHFALCFSYILFLQLVYIL